MLTSPEALLAIAGMALVTFMVKAGGLLLANRLPRDGFAAAWLKHIPGAVLASLVAPALVTGSPAEVIAAAITPWSMCSPAICCRPWPPAYWRFISPGCGLSANPFSG